jgi:hypothetical protein
MTLGEVRIDAVDNVPRDVCTLLELPIGSQPQSPPGPEGRGRFRGAAHGVAVAAGECVA